MNFRFRHSGFENYFASHICKLLLAMLVTIIAFAGFQRSASAEMDDAWISAEYEVEIDGDEAVITVRLYLNWDDSGGSDSYNITGPAGQTASVGSGEDSYEITDPENPITIEVSTSSIADVLLAVIRNIASLFDLFREFIDDDLLGEWTVESVCGQGSASASAGGVGSGGGSGDGNGSGNGDNEDDSDADDDECDECEEECEEETSSYSCSGECGNPIQYRLGNKVQSQRIFSYPTKGGNINFRISYNSARAYKDSDIGYAWTHNYNIWFEELKSINGDAPGVIAFHLGNRNMIILKYGSDDYDCLIDNMWVDETYNGTKLRVRIGSRAYIFEEIAIEEGANPDTVWKATSITKIMEEEARATNGYDYNDWLGFTTTLTYYSSGDDIGKLEKITCPGGREYKFYYWDDNYPSSGGLDGKLKEVRHPNYASNSKILGMFKYYYEDEGENDVTDGNLTQVIDVEGQTTDYVYHTTLRTGETNNDLKHMLREVHYPCSAKTFFDFHLILNSFNDPLSDDSAPIVSYFETKIGSSPTEGPYYQIHTIDHDYSSSSGIVTNRWTEVKKDNDNNKISKYYVSNKFSSPESKVIDPEDKTRELERDNYNNITKKTVYDDEEDCWVVTLKKYYDSDEDEAEEGLLYKRISRRYATETAMNNDASQLASDLENSPHRTYTYGDLGRMTSSTGSDGIKHVRQHDESDEISHLEAEWDECSDETVFNKVEYEYYTDESSGAYRYLLKKVKKHVDSQGTTLDTEYTYNSYGDITQVVTKSGTTTLRTVTYTYDSNYIGRPLTMVQPGQDGNRTTTYAYDYLLRNTSEVLPKADSNAKHFKTEWTYECNTKIKDTIKSYGDDTNGWNKISKTRNEYDSITGKLKKIWLYDDPDDTNNPTTNNATLMAEYDYYDDGSIKWVKNPRGYKTESVYYYNGWLKEKRFYYDSSNYYKEEYTYYANGQTKTVEDYISNIIAAEGGSSYTTEYKYDDHGRLSEVVDPENGSSYSTEYTYIGSTNLKDTITNPEGEVTDYDYDKYKRVESVTIDPGTEPHLALKTEYEYDYLGRGTQVKDPNGNETNYTYDIQDRQTKIEYADDTTVEYTYTDPGTVETVKTQIGTTTYEYDELDRKTSIEDPEENETAYAYDDFDFTNDLREDTVTDPDNKTTTYTYDFRGWLVKITDPKNKDTTYEYDDNDNMTKLTDAEENDTTFTYDYRDWPLVTTYPNSKTLTYSYDNYNDTGDTYGFDDTLYSTRTDRDGKVTLDFPDKLNRTKEIRYIESDNDPVEKTEYTYDRTSRILSATVTDMKATSSTEDDEQVSKIEWVFDDADRVTREDQQIDSAGTEEQVSYQYDDASNRTQISYPDSMVLTLEYDNMNRLDKIKESTDTIADYHYNAVSQPVRVELLNGTQAVYTYDKAGRLMKLENLYSSEGKVISSFTYQRTDAGYPTTITREDGYMIDYTYDDNHQVTQEKMVDSQADMVYQHDYTYDDVGNRDWKYYDNDDTNKKVIYTNNSMNQITDVLGTRGLKMTVTGTVSDLMEDGETKKGDLDKVEVTPAHTDGTKVTGTMVTATIREPFFVARGVELWDDDDNEVEAKAYDKAGNTDTDTTQSNVEMDDDVDVDYTYDDNGCLDDDGTYTYHYDYENNLVEVKLKSGGSTVSEYVYDALGRRIKKTVKDSPDVVTRYIYDGQNIIEEYDYDSGWELKAEYVHGIGIDDVLRMDYHHDSGTEDYYFHKDGMGSTSEITDDEAVMVQAYEYDAWGNVTIYDPGADIENPFLYTAREWDSEIGLYYYRARHYAPHLGSFMQPDPIGYDDGPNLYVYVGNIPTSSFDPYGLKDYEIGTSDPHYKHDPGAGKHGSSKASWEMWLLKWTILDKLHSVGHFMPNAAAHLRHYLSNTGRTKKIKLSDMIRDVPSAKRLYEAELDEAKAFVESLEEGKHSITSGAVSMGYNRKSESKDWFFAVAGYKAWGKGKATVECTDGEWEYTLSFVYKFADRYNWDKGKSVKIGPVTVPDKFMGRWHREGYAKEFDMKGSVKEKVEWEKSANGGNPTEGGGGGGSR